MDQRPATSLENEYPSRGGEVFEKPTSAGPEVSAWLSTVEVAHALTDAIGAYPETSSEMLLSPEQRSRNAIGATGEEIRRLRLGRLDSEFFITDPSKTDFGQAA